MSKSIVTKPLPIIYIPKDNIFPFNFLLCDCPSEENVEDYMKFFNAYNVSTIIRICEPLYNIPVNSKIKLVDEIKFEDGGVPSLKNLDTWCHILDEAERVKDENNTLCVHCISGYGRAPVLIASACLYKNPNLDSFDVIDALRKHRRGVLNKRQIEWLENECKKKLKRLKIKKWWGF
jgi:protein tyrosine phosphatase type 4A